MVVWIHQDNHHSLSSHVYYPQHLKKRIKILVCYFFLFFLCGFMLIRLKNKSHVHLSPIQADSVFFDLYHKTNQLSKNNTYMEEHRSKHLRTSLVFEENLSHSMWTIRGIWSLPFYIKLNIGGTIHDMDIDTGSSLTWMEGPAPWYAFCCNLQYIGLVICLNHYNTKSFIQMNFNFNKFKGPLYFRS